MDQKLNLESRLIETEIDVTRLYNQIQKSSRTQKMNFEKQLQSRMWGFVDQLYEEVLKYFPLIKIPNLISEIEIRISDEEDLYKLALHQEFDHWFYLLKSQNKEVRNFAQYFVITTTLELEKYESLGFLQARAVEYMKKTKKILARKYKNQSTQKEKLKPGTLPNFLRNRLDNLQIEMKKLVLKINILRNPGEAARKFKVGKL